MFNRIKVTFKKQDGFTLIELVIVLAIIGIILGIALPSLAKTTESAKKKADLASARTLLTATHLAILDDPSLSEVTLDYLEKNNYIDSVPKPQVKGEEGFKITIENGKVRVTYIDDKVIDGE